jgi:hypothetical protein
MLMLKSNHRSKILIIAMLVLFTVTTACSISALQEEPAPTQVPPVTVVFTQVVTQIILPTLTPEVTVNPEITPTPSPTVQVISSGEYDAFSAPQWYPIKGCPASRLHLGDRAFVTRGGGPNGIRFGADVRYDTIIGYAQEGEGMLILDGPFCYYGWLVWQVKTDGGLNGFTPEGDGEEYWLLPEEKP